MEDLDSHNGVSLGEGKVSRAQLRIGDSVRLGDVVVFVTQDTDHGVHGLVQPYERIIARIGEDVARSCHERSPTSVLSVQAREGSASHIGHWCASLARQLRPVDGLGVYGARTALIVLPDTPSDAARQVGLRLCAENPALTIGVATFPEHASSAAQLVARATDAVQEAHGAGGVVLARQESHASGRPDVIIVEPHMRELYEVVARVARTDVPVLILGETGAGKELVASAVHHESRRKGGPLQVVNCAALPETLLESLLFGHERGAFTGASRAAAGVFEQASGGTLFLDEIGELSLSAQAALLRALETKRILRLGSSREIQVDVRMVAATHRPLEEMVARGQFRQDLFHRLNTFTVQVPALRERPSEILPLAEHFLGKAVQRWGLHARSFSREVEERLLAYAWPGNVRELRNVLERAAAICLKKQIDLEDLPETLRGGGSVQTEATETSASPTRAIEDAEGAKPLRQHVQELEERLIRKALQETRGNQVKAAELLQMPRRTFTQRLTQYGIDPRDP